MNDLATEDNQRLDLITTRWTMLGMVNEASFTSAIEARSALVLRYSTAIRKYVGAILRNDEDADEVTQDVIVRLLKGDFSIANRDRGRFRDLLKTAVRNMVKNHWSRENRRRGAAIDVEQLEVETPDDSDDQPWLAAWRRGVLDLAWNELKRFEQQHEGSLLYTLLRLRADYPDDTSDQLADRLSAMFGKRAKPDAVRQQLRRARLRFAEFLIDEIGKGLDAPSPEQIEEELISLGLHEHVREFLPARQTNGD